MFTKNNNNMNPKPKRDKNQIFAIIFAFLIILWTISSVCGIVTCAKVNANADMTTEDYQTHAIEFDMPCLNATLANEDADFSINLPFKHSLLLTDNDVALRIGSRTTSFFNPTYFGWFTAVCYGLDDMTPSMEYMYTLSTSVTTPQDYFDAWEYIRVTYNLYRHEGGVKYDFILTMEKGVQIVEFPFSVALNFNAQGIDSFSGVSPADDTIPSGLYRGKPFFTAGDEVLTANFQSNGRVFTALQTSSDVLSYWSGINRTESYDDYWYGHYRYIDFVGVSSVDTEVKAWFYNIFAPIAVNGFLWLTDVYLPDIDPISLDSTYSGTFGAYGMSITDYINVYENASTGTGNSFDTGYGMGYGAGRTDGYNVGIDEGYRNGYSDGLDDGENLGFNDGFNEGYTDGYTEGDVDGYNRGYYTGMSDGGDYTFMSLFSSVIDAPVQAFTGLFNFELLGINLSGFFLALLTAGVCLAILRLII